ncbi:UPF0173 metal-dependent hydrolase [Tetragenococcus halophilus subsp. flandriensis]|uniref:metal-dependent hydrolase n=1 Tax=Tetragenococcus halophilus TaxID=51669 RepID=UPI0023EA32A8|nr:metal-dependent hydrolase [Tetragenococcus halophilus]GMA06890.1 UPF0173 metal-dependent hydrolase [Tetragenococcus halophilus subsp. flandriensis]
MKITYHGHAVVSVVLDNGTRLLFDPFISQNPLADISAEDVETDYILITHGHDDHIGDMVSIAKKNNATVIGLPEVCAYAASKGIEKTHGMNIGGGYDFPFGRVKFTHAQHSSGYQEDGQMIYMGEPAGILLQAEGKTIYHAGDTADYSDLSLLGEQYDIDVAFLPIGDNFTMGPEDALRAANRLKAKTVVPIHYNTFPQIKQDPQKFVEQLTTVGKVMNSGEAIEV